jgi:hypothetical protein
MSARRIPLPLLLGASLLWACTGCDDEPVAPNSSNQLQSCFACHGDTPGSTTVSLAAITTEYQHSLHATGENWQRKTATCAGCHNNEGFLQRVQTGAFPSANLQHSSPIDCWTCHAPHTTGNFGLRTTAPVTFLDGSGSFDYGEANLCANCHQSRPASPPVPPEGSTITPTSSRWGPHNACMANMFSGQGGFTTAANPATNSEHTTAVTDACVRCHMAAPPTSGLAGGHSWKMSYDAEGVERAFVESCRGCHSDIGSTFDYRGTQSATAALIDSVRTRLLGANLIDSSDLLVPQTLTRTQAQAVWNFRMVLEDRSTGIHNTNYARAMLRSALEFVPPPPAGVARR